MKFIFRVFLVILLILISFIAFILSPFFSFAQESGVSFPYQINFTESEKKFLQSLDQNTLLKLIQIAKTVQQANLQKASSTQTTNTQQTTQTNPYLYNSNTQQTTQTNPYLQNSNQTGQVNTSQAQANPYAGTAYETYFAESQRQYGNSPTGGYESARQTLSSSDLGTLPKLGSGGADCSTNFGAIGNLNGVTSRVKFDTGRLCNAFGKKIKVVDAKRGCNGPSRHCFGEAIDFEVKTYGDKKQQALLVVAFIALGYNIGSYERGFPLHADHEAASKWKTWSRWAHTNGRAPLPYEDAVRDALSLIGMPANSASEFRSKYGNPTKATMSSKAKAFLVSVYGEEAEKFKPAGN